MILLHYTLLSLSTEICRVIQICDMFEEEKWAFVDEGKLMLRSGFFFVCLFLYFLILILVAISMPKQFN